jgi:hypothetical protein
MITPDVQAIAGMLDVSDLSKLLKKSPRFIKEQLLQTGLIRAGKIGNEWRVRPCDLTAFQDRMARGQVAYLKATKGA